MLTRVILLGSAIAAVISIALLLLSPAAQQPTGLYGGNFSDSASSVKVTADMHVNLPADHLSHPEFAIEWWYLTANLFDQAGNQYPLQWTLFRFRQSGELGTQQQFMAHAKVSTQANSWFEERFARAALLNTAVTLEPQSGNFSAYLDDWQWLGSKAQLLPAQLNFSVQQQVQVALQLTATGPYVAHGDRGYSTKLRDNSHASMYYSQPFIQLAGHLSLPDNTVAVSGQGWFDHEWSGRLSDPQTQGWDWFSLHLENGDKLMIYKVRHARLGDSWFGSLITKNGRKQGLNGQQIQTTILAYTDLDGDPTPLDWHIAVPDFGIDIRVSPFKTDQRNSGLFSYYEGAVDVSGSHQGVGFMELTGYN